MIYDVDRRTRQEDTCVFIAVIMASQDSCSSSARSSVSDGDSADETTMEDCLGTQPYLFEPHDSDASSDTDSTSESEDGQQFERLQNTDW